MERVAIPVVKGKLSEYFGHCNHYEIFEIDGENIQSNEIEVLPHHDITKLPEWAVQQGITDIIAYKVDKKFLSLFTGNKINLFIGVPINTPRILIEEYLSGNLKSDEKIIKEITE
ncbi:hypothetical protein ES705_11929 [subsurface metagenome]